MQKSGWVAASAMRRIWKYWLNVLWAIQYPIWWLAPESLTFYAYRAFYARRVARWLNAKNEGADER